jgi:hypothetical protein
LQKHTVSIFRPEVAMLGSGVICTGSEEEETRENGPFRIEEEEGKLSKSAGLGSDHFCFIPQH